MRHPGIPDTVTQFIRDYIDRLETLEVLALLIATPARAWTTDEISEQMRSSGTASQMALESLVRVELAAVDGQAFRFRPANVGLGDGARTVLDCYRDRGTAVIAAIYQNHSQNHSR